MLDQHKDIVGTDLSFHHYSTVPATLIILTEQSVK